MAYMAQQKNQNFYIGQESQVAQFIKKWQPLYSEMEPKYTKLCADLQNTLQKIFPGCQLHRFGSSVTGLYFKDSDIDIYVQLAAKDPNLDAKKIVQKAKTLLQKYGNIFTEITAIPTARTPICKFLHMSTSIRCDFNFNSVTGVYNSWFVRYFLSLDHRLRHLMMVIKYWAKMQGLISTSDFSNYALTIMFIFYLQHMHSLPAVISLQTADSINVQEDWNVGMDYGSHFMSPSLNESTAEDILFGFFYYYIFFDYVLDIICPFLGYPISKPDFLAFEMFEPMFQIYKINSTRMPPLQVKSEICVQDPFQHVSNVTDRVSNACVKKFVGLCKHACQIFERRPVYCNALEELFNTRDNSINTPRSNERTKSIDKVEEKVESPPKPTKKRNKKRKKKSKQLETSKFEELLKTRNNSVSTSRSKERTKNIDRVEEKAKLTLKLAKKKQKNKCKQLTTVS